MTRSNSTCSCRHRAQGGRAPRSRAKTTLLLAVARPCVRPEGSELDTPGPRFTGRANAPLLNRLHRRTWGPTAPKPPVAPLRLGQTAASPQPSSGEGGRLLESRPGWFLKSVEGKKRLRLSGHRCANGFTFTLPCRFSTASLTLRIPTSRITSRCFAPSRRHRIAVCSSCSFLCSLSTGGLGHHRATVAIAARHRASTADPRCLTVLQDFAALEK